LLSSHGDAETELAYSVLDHALADRGAVEQLYQDHREIDAQFKLIHRATDPVEALRLFKRVLAATREHFRREEKIVFPVLEQTLQPATQQTLGQKWLENYTVSARA
jgi:iron-sulfur cluster repair protein YtfE (RIC family)